MYIYLEKLKEVSLNNKYFLWYENIIKRAYSRAKCRKTAKLLLGYVEGHHIIPISFKLGGEKDNENIVFLTAKEHIIVHRLMCKFTSGEFKTKSLRAFHCMCFVHHCRQNKRKPSLYQLAIAREYSSTANKEIRGIKGVPWWCNDADNIEDFKNILKDLVEEGLSDPKIGQIYKVSAVTINEWRKKLGIKRRREKMRDREWLYEQYIHKEMSAAMIGDIVGCTGTAIQHYLNKFNIPIRNSFERQKLRKNRRINSGNSMTNG